ncbi:cobalamin-binding protein [Candidimonas sp. SYP-B2681]|uniref:cobalamin-binding protein n=1 Tax=Candidimonas sp. SYP-B2681 TaxID=2497686 RepID=UPI000F88FA00|nr:cobalamin-binding protein [Candidimonas sp. SYP-B2681]RTZ39756.1 cobalamin-binding protein [Candidimonas sp. SYP-B2681]
MSGMCSRWNPVGIAARSLVILGLLATCVFHTRAQTAEVSLLPDAAQVAESMPPAARVITLAPHITELVFAAGAGEKIVATVTSSDYPRAALAIPRIGDGLNISVEKALAVRPDLVIAWQPSGAAVTLAPILSQLDIPLLYSAPRTLDEVKTEIVRFGALFSTQAIAGPAAQHFADRLEAINSRYAHRKPVSVFIEVGTAPLYTIGNDPLLNDALRICAGVNVYANAAIAAPQVTIESVLLTQPDVVLAAASNTARLADSQKRWTELKLPAALDGHVYGINPDELFRPGPRLIDATEKLCQYLDLAR